MCTKSKHGLEPTDLGSSPASATPALCPQAGYPTSSRLGSVHLPDGLL